MYLLAYQQFGLAYLFLLAHYDFMQTVEYYEYLTTKCLSLWRLFCCAKYIPFTRNVMVIGVDLPRTRMFRRLASRCESHVTIYCVTCVSRSVKLILSPGLGFQYKYGISLEILSTSTSLPPKVQVCDLRLKTGLFSAETSAPETLTNVHPGGVYIYQNYKAIIKVHLIFF